jgi:uncharacterized protein
MVGRAAARHRQDRVRVANRRLQKPPGNRFVRAERVEGGPDAADRYINEHARVGEVAVTADIPLASLLVESGA